MASSHLHHVRHTTCSLLAALLLASAILAIGAGPNAVRASSLPWNIVISASTSTTQNNYLEGVTCVSASDCWAVGYYYTGLYDQTLIEQWNGTSWSIATSANASALDSNYLYSVTCVSASDCWAVGYYVDGVYNQTLIEQWNGTSWSVVTSANTSLTDDDNLDAITCISASDCWGVGYYWNGTYLLTLIEQWNGTSWSVVSSPNGNATQNNKLHGVACASTSECWATGWYYTGSVYLLLGEQYNGSTWTLATMANPNTAANSGLYSVTCVSASDCWAAGYINNPNPAPLVEQYNGTSWTAFEPPGLTTTHDNYLYGVTCASSSDCWAVGKYYNGTNSQTLVEQYYGGSWGTVTSSNTSSTENNYLAGVTCASSSDCWAVGYSDNSGGYAQPLVEQYQGYLTISAPTTLNLGTLVPGSVVGPIALGSVTWTDTLDDSTTSSVTVASTDLYYSSSVYLPFTDMAMGVGQTITQASTNTGPNNTAGSAGPTALSGTDTTPGTTYSGSLTLATGSATSQGSYTQGSNTITASVPANLLTSTADALTATVQYTITG